MKSNIYAPMIAAFFSFSSVTPGILAAASYDCSRASTITEHAICDFPELSTLDEVMGQAYQSAKASSEWITPAELRETQRTWIQNRNKCGDNFECLRSSYTQRLEEISDGVLSIDISDKVMFEVYQGEPISGACSNGTKLNDLGQCVNRFRGGPSFRGLSVAGTMAFNFEYLAANAHTCALSGRADKENGLWVYQEDGFGCTLRIELGENGLSLNPTPECNSYCGMRAYGAMEQTIKY